MHTDAAMSGPEEMRQIGEILARNAARIDARFDRVDGRFDRMDGRLDGVETKLERVETRLDRVEGRLDGVEVRLDRVKTVGGETIARLDRMELANERRFDRIDAKLEQLVHLVVRDETSSSRRRPKKGGPNHS